MNQENRQCQNCQQQFTIEPEDFAFYEKMQVPAPTWCPQCREQRRISFRNERSLYRRACDLCKKEIISVYSPDKDFFVYCPNCYNSEKWDPYAYGREYDFSKPFFIQMKELQSVVPRISLIQDNAVNSEWINFERNAKNCYLDVGGEETENCAYCTYAVQGKQLFDCYWVFSSELCYETLKSGSCYNTFFSLWSFNCTDSWFSYDCVDCSNVIGCIGLRHKNYHIFNQPVSKEEYDEFVRTYINGSYVQLQKLIEKVRAFQATFPRRETVITKSESCAGNFIESSKNATNCWHGQNIEDSKHIYIAANVKTSYDVSPSINCEQVYEVLSCAEANNIKFSFIVWGGIYNFEYCESMIGGHDCFGSIGLRNGEYSILNKKYSPEEYVILRKKIIQHMNEMPYQDSKGNEHHYGEFFPPAYSPFAYNESVAYEYFPLSEQQALSQGYAWKSKVGNKAQPTIETTQLADSIHQVDQTITKEVIACAHAAECQENCSTVFRYIAPEIDFYKSHNIPLPRLCPNCRHAERIRQLNPRMLWQRDCDCFGIHSKNSTYINTAAHTHGDQQCMNKVKTVFSPEQTAIIYCTDCYNSEVI